MLEAIRERFILVTSGPGPTGPTGTLPFMHSNLDAGHGLLSDAVLLLMLQSKNRNDHGCCLNPGNNI